MPEIVLPTFHAVQAEIYRNRAQHNVLRCGRRFGKDIFQNTITADRIMKGGMVGLFAPEHKQLLEPFDAIAEILAPCKRRSSRNEGIFRSKVRVNGHYGGFDIWPLTDNPLAGRGREYDDVIVNEAAFTKSPQMIDQWKKGIKPTLLIRRGRSWVMSTPMGIDPENFFYAACNDPQLGFREHYAPTSANPLVPVEELEEERKRNDPLVFQQEYEAKFIDWSGVAFFALDKMLDDGTPIAYPTKCDGVFAVLDTAVKAGKEHDGTAVLYVATNQIYGTPLILLDYDIVQIEGSLLETWLPTVFQRCEALAAECGARHGSQGVWIEDTAAGIMLLQQGYRRGWNVNPIDSKFVAMGKDERAISVSGHVYQGKVKFTQYCYDKTVNFKGTTRNHLLTQVTGFRVGDKQAAKRADDLTDCFTAAISIALGNMDGY